MIKIGSKVHAVIDGYSWLATVVGFWEQGPTVKVDSRHTHYFKDNLVHNVTNFEVYI